MDKIKNSNKMERWNELCYNLSENISPNLSEDLFELKVIQALGVLGWKGYNGDLNVRTSFQVGASKRLIPDIIVKSENSNLFVIEVKKPQISLNSDFGSQLKSYMRQLKLDIGILIGQNIQIFYDGTLFGNNKFILIDEIEFKRDSENGQNFVNLFNKTHFSYQNIEQYVQYKIDAINEVKDIKNLCNEIESPEYTDYLKNELKILLLKNYSKNIVEKVLEKTNVLISNDTNNYINPEQILFKQKLQNNKQRFSLNLGENKITKIYTIDKPLNLAFTVITKGKIENENANNWQNLLRIILKKLLNKGISYLELKNKTSLNIQTGNINERGFYQISSTNYSLQNVDANIAGRSISVLARDYKIKVDIEFKWRDKPNAAFPNEYCKFSI